MTVPAIERVRRAFWEGLQPDPIMTVSEWAEKFRRLPKEASAEHGKWRNARTPYLVEIMDSLSVNSIVEEVSFMKGAQIGGTEAGNNFLGYCMDLGLGPTMAVSKTETLAKRFAKQRLRPMIRDTPRLSAKVSAPTKRDGSNTLLHIAFDGGQLMLVNAEAAGGLRSMPIRNLFGDEVDSYPLDVEGEGDPCDLAKARTRTFGRRKVLWVSTPTEESTSRIAKEFLAGDRRRYHVPCPGCGDYQVLEWKRLRYEKDDEGNLEGDVRHLCEECGYLAEEWEKTKMFALGRWVPGKGNADPRVRSYHLSSLYSPVGWCSWEQIVKAFIAAEGDVKKLKVWVNTMLGETWKERGDAPDWEVLYNRRETYKLGQVPKGAVFLTMGVDVQKDRLEYEVVAWGPDRESWSIEFGIINTDVTTKKWHKPLDELRLREWATEDGGTLRIRRAAIDTGYQAHHVYSYARTRSTVMCVKGSQLFPEIVGPAKLVDINLAGRKIKRGVKLHMVGTNVSKMELYSFLRNNKPAEGPLPTGWCHFPQHPAEYFKQLTAEHVVTKKNTRGYTVRVWEKIRERNEALDCRVYARAAASIIGLDRWGEERWKKEKAAMGHVAPKRQKRTPKKGYLQGGESTWPGI